MNKNEFIRGIVGRYGKYCDGFALSNWAYVTAVTVHTNIMEHHLSLSKLVDPSKLYQINAFDLAEVSGPYMGQINMITVSSFSGPNGFIWGYDLAKNEDLDVFKKEPLLTLTNNRDDKNKIVVYSASPLIAASYELFGTEKEKHFPLYPGSHVPCVNSFYHSMPKDKYVFSAIGIGIVEDRTKNTDLFMQYADGIKKSINEDEAKVEIIKALAESVIEVGRNQRLKYKEIYVEVEIKKIPNNKYGCAFTAIPYLLLAKDAIPNQKVEILSTLSLSKWKDLVQDRFLKYSK